MRNSHSDLADQIKAVVSMRAVADRYGLEVSRGGFIACPFHTERTPSLKLYNEPGRGFYCYGCGAGGSVIDFAMRLLNLDFRQAAVRLASDFGIVCDADPGTRQEALAARTARTERARQLARYDRLVARWRRLSSIRWAQAPQGPDDEWPGEWGGALRELAGLEYEIEQMEVAGFGR